MDDNTFNAYYNFIPQIFRDWMQDKLDLTKATILDFGTGTGVIALGLAEHCQAKRVLGIDINDNHKNLLNALQGHLNLSALPENLYFQTVAANEPLTKTFADEEIDCIFSWSVFEHVSQDLLSAVVSELTKLLQPGGYIFFQVAPLYYSAFGSHMDMLIPQPWSHLTTQFNLFQDRILNADKGHVYADESDENFCHIKESLWSTFITLNKMTADDLLKIFSDAGLTLVRQYRTQNTQIPPEQLVTIYNEEVLTTEQIVCLFRKDTSAPA